MKTKTWSVLVHDHSLKGKIMELLFGNYLEIQADELNIGQFGYFEAIDTDTNSAQYIWFKDVVGWTNNHSLKESTEKNKQHVMEQLQKSLQIPQVTMPQMNSTQGPMNGMAEPPYEGVAQLDDDRAYL
jgi:hypothetical protein